MLDKSKIDKELARRLSAAFNQMGVSITTRFSLSISYFNSVYSESETEGRNPASLRS
jgi:hypothetical protein